jgi:hypothetical protein
MSRVNRPVRSDDQQLVRYLLGQLPDKDTERLDEASVVDDDVALRLRIVEHDLVDSYVTGTLDRDMIAPFESRYLSSPRRQRQVRFARGFMRAIGRAARARPAASRFKMSSRFAIPSRLMAAAALMLVVSGALLFQAVQWRNGLHDAQTATFALERRARALEQALTEQRAAHDAVSTEVTRLRESAARTSSASASTPTVALVLHPQTRAVGPVPAVAIPARMDALAVELRIESNDAPRYDATLTDAATNQAVWKSGPLRAASRGEATTVSLAIPTRLLESQHYSLALTAARPGDSIVVASYSFEVVRR